MMPIWHRKKLTKNQRKFLKKMEEMPGAPIVEIAREAGVPANTYYRLMKRQDFRELMPKHIDDLLATQTYPVLQSVKDRALAGSAKHAEIFLRSAGIYGGDQTVKIQIFGRDGDTSVRYLSDAEAKTLLSYLEAKRDERTGIKKANIEQRALPSGQEIDD